MLYSSSLSYSSIRFIMQSFTVWVIGKLRFFNIQYLSPEMPNSMPEYASTPGNTSKYPTACQNTLPVPAIRQNIQHHARILLHSLQYVKISNTMPEYTSLPAIRQNIQHHARIRSTPCKTSKYRYIQKIYTEYVCPCRRDVCSHHANEHYNVLFSCTRYFDEWCRKKTQILILCNISFLTQTFWQNKYNVIFKDNIYISVAILRHRESCNLTNHKNCVGLASLYSSCFSYIA